VLLTTRLPAQKPPGYQPTSVQDQGSSTLRVAASWASIAHMRRTVRQTVPHLARREVITWSVAGARGS
jgi:hypothetical protein